MQEVRITDIEKFIATVEESIKQMDSAISRLESYYSRAHEIKLPINILKKEKEYLECELKKFREGNISELVKDGFSGYDRLVGYNEIILNEDDDKE